MERVADSLIPVQVSFRALFALYLSLPICLTVYAVDAFLLKGALLNRFPAAPESYFYTALFFGVPHIIASNMILATNSEYLQFFRARLITASIVIISFMVFSYLVLSSTVNFVILAVATIVHVVRQQLGIGNILARQSGIAYQLWYWSVISGSVVMYLGVFIGYEFSQFVFVFKPLLFCFTVVIFVSAAIVYPRIRGNVPQAYFLGNTALAVGGFFLYSQKYYFLAILGPRIVHDLTAFIFYMAHDANRHLDRPKNHFYQLLRRFHIHPYLAVPVFAVAIAYFMQFPTRLFGEVTKVNTAFMIYLTYMHYYTESFTWKGDSPYRQFITFKV